MQEFSKRRVQWDEEIPPDVLTDKDRQACHLVPFCEDFCPSKEVAQQWALFLCIGAWWLLSGKV